MTWPAASILLAAASAIAATVVLVVLHFLKVHLPRQPVATTLFWRQALQEEHRRAIFGRWSRWRSFLLLLLISLLLAATLAGLRWPAQRRDEPLAIVIDAGFSMKVPAESGETRLDQALQAARDDLARAGGASVSVIVAGESPRLLIRPDQPSGLASASLNGIHPASAPAASDQAIELAASLLPADRGTILWYTDRSEAPQSLSDAVRKRVQRRAVGEPADNAAIVAVTYEPTDADRAVGRLRVRVASWPNSSTPSDVKLTHDGATRSTQTGQTATGLTTDALFDSLPADGSVCAVELAKGGAARDDDRVTVRLPRLVLIRFSTNGDLPESLRRALDAISTPGAKDAITILASDSTPSSSFPAIQFVHGGLEVQPGTFVSLSPSPLASGLNLENARCGQGSDLRTASGKITPLLIAGDAVLMAVVDETARRVLISDAVFAPESDLPQRPGFFLLLARACRSLAGDPASPVLLPLERAVSDPLWTPADASAQDVSFATGSRAASDLTAAPSVQKTLPPLASVRVPVELWQLTLVLAIALLVVESVLYWRGRIV